MATEIFRVTLSATLVALAAWASYTDFKARRIANWLTFGGAALALSMRAMVGLPMLLAGAEGWLLGGMLLVVPFLAGWMGAGDVKLLAAFGAVGGPAFVIQTALLGCVAGGVIAIVYLAREGRLVTALRDIVSFLGGLLGFGLPCALESHSRVPFGPALAAGAVASLVGAGGLL